jgi:hypothetical protein
VCGLPVATRPEDLTATIAGLIGDLGRLRDVLGAGTFEEQKAVISAFLQEIRVMKVTRQAVLRWYRLPRDLSLILVELRGLEPLTPRLPALCSPN